jgi:hypothetical protein
MAEQLQELRRLRSNAAQAFSVHLGFPSSHANGALALAKDIFDYRRSELLLFQYTAEVIADLCVVKGLPSGDPPWMSELIMSYL